MSAFTSLPPWRASAAALAKNAMIQKLARRGMRTSFTTARTAKASPTLEEQADLPRFDIRTTTGVLLWQDTILTDIPTLIAIMRAKPDADRQWFQELVAHPVHYAAPTRLLKPVTQGLVLASIDGRTEPMRYCGGNLGLNDGPIFIDVCTPTRRADIPLSDALRNIDLFEPPSQAVLLAQVTYWFDCELRGAE